jgi:hypothetical protein
MQGLMLMLKLILKEVIRAFELLLKAVAAALLR